MTWFTYKITPNPGHKGPRVALTLNKPIKSLTAVDVLEILRELVQLNKEVDKIISGRVDMIAQDYTRLLDLAIELVDKYGKDETKLQIWKIFSTLEDKP
jgi:hypothetical protein